MGKVIQLRRRVPKEGMPSQQDDWREVLAPMLGTAPPSPETESRMKFLNSIYGGQIKQLEKEESN